MIVLIIEDEQIAALNLEKLLITIDPQISVLARIDSVRSAVKWLSANSCDLIFMDIQLSDGNSFSIFDQVEVKTPVIFTTAFDQFAIKAFKHNSIDYLLKPINIDELKAGINKYKELHQSKPNADIKELLNSLRNPVQYQERFLVSAGAKMRTVKTSEIAYFYVQGAGVFLCTSDNKSYDVNFTLDKLEEILDPKHFFRVNRQYIVNIDAIESMVTVSKSRLQLHLKPKHENEVVVSVYKMQDFRLWVSK